MSNRTHRHALATLAAAATLMFGGIASGAFYSSSFDPPGPIDFTGHGLFYVSDACLSPGFHTAADCGMRLDTATVDMTDTVSGDTGHLNFAPALPNSVDMISFYMGDHGDMLGANTGLIGWTFADEPCTGTLCNIPWWVQWQFSVDVDPVYLYAGSCDTDLTYDTSRVSTKALGPCSAFDNAAGVAFNVTFARVPEPGTLALLVSALGAGWLARRRKTR